jgi:streptomycin 6-kinase
MNFRDSIPKELVTHTIAMCGEIGKAWLDDLPALIRHLETAWSISVEDPFPSVEFNYVAAATDGLGQQVVIKISPPFDNTEIFSEAKFLGTLNGNGAVWLLAEDRERRAILVERAIPGASLTELYDGNELEAIGPAINVLRTITAEPPDDLTDTIDLDDWFDGLTRYNETAFPARYAKRALDIYADLSGNAKRQYLHGDFHPSNVVSGTREWFLAIDPKGMIGPIGYDIAVFLNNFHWWHEERTDVRARSKVAVEKFSDGFGISSSDLRRWAFAQMVLSAWWTFDEMPEIYDNEVAKADIWDI